jgi:hypothetical protein
MSQITEFLPQLQQLRTVYTDFIELDEVDFDAFRKAVDFYYAHRDVGQFEKMMLDILFEKDKQTMAIVLSSLKGELDKILDIYYESDAIFDEAEPEIISDNIEMSHYSEIEELIPKLNSCGAEFCEAVGMVSQEAERPEGISDEDAWAKYETALAQHQSITEQLHAIYQKQKECQQIAKRYYFNPFASLCDLLETFQEIVEKYLPSEIKTVTPTAAPVVTTTVASAGYFNMGLVSAIHKLCNGEQFEDISELDLYAILNAQSDKPLNVKSGEKTRICYLIHCLSEQIKGAEKLAWRNEMLKRLDISESYYTSKYREPASEIPSQKSIAFANNLKNIFE